MGKSKRKGIWIPNFILEDEKLDAANKIIMAEIISLSELEKGCYAGDEHFAKLVGIKRTSVNKRINKLVELGYLMKNSINGKGKYLFPIEQVKNHSPVPKRTPTCSLEIEIPVPTGTLTSSLENTINTGINSTILKQELIHHSGENLSLKPLTNSGCKEINQAEAARNRIARLEDEIAIAARDGIDIIQNYRYINKGNLWDYVDSRNEYDKVLPLLKELVYLSKLLYGK